MRACRVDAFRQRVAAKGCSPLDRLVESYDLDQINEAASEAEEGNTLKPVLRVG